MKTAIALLFCLLLAGCSPKNSEDLRGQLRHNAMRMHALKIRQAMTQKRLARLAKRHEADMQTIRRLREDLEFDADYVGELTFVVDKLIDSVSRLREKTGLVPGIAQGQAPSTPEQAAEEMPLPLTPEQKKKQKKVLESVA